MRIKILVGDRPVVLENIGRLVIEHDNGTPLAVAVELHGAVSVVDANNEDFNVVLTGLGLGQPVQVDRFKPAKSGEILVR